MQKALLSGDHRTVKSCLDGGFSIDGRLPTRKGRAKRETPLMIAAELGKVAMAKVLLERGADPNVEAEFQTTALRMAVSVH